MATPKAIFRHKAMPKAIFRHKATPKAIFRHKLVFRLHHVQAGRASTRSYPLFTLDVHVYVHVCTCVTGKRK